MTFQGGFARKVNPCHCFIRALNYVLLVNILYNVNGVALKSQNVCWKLQKGIESAKVVHESVQEGYDRKCPPSSAVLAVYSVGKSPDVEVNNMYLSKSALVSCIIYYGIMMVI